MIFTCICAKAQFVCCLSHVLREGKYNAMTNLDATFYEVTIDLADFKENNGQLNLGNVDTCYAKTENCKEMGI